MLLVLEIATLVGGLEQGRLLSFLHLTGASAQQIPPFSKESIGHMLVLNERVHYGTDQQLMAEYAKAMQATAEKFYQHLALFQSGCRSDSLLLAITHRFGLARVPL